MYTCQNSGRMMCSERHKIHNTHSPKPVQRKDTVQMKNICNLHLRRWYIQICKQPCQLPLFPFCPFVLSPFISHASHYTFLLPQKSFLSIPVVLFLVSWPIPTHIHMYTPAKHYKLELTYEGKNKIFIFLSLSYLA